MGKVVQFPANQGVDVQERSSPATGFYTTGEAARIARIPRHRLYAWRREGIILPTVLSTDAEGNEDTGYTFHALVYLRVLRMLRDRNVPLLAAVEIVDHLHNRFGPPGPGWEDARIFIQGPDVFVDRKDAWEVTDSTRKGQKAAPGLMGEEFAQLRERADALLVPRRFQPYVEIDPAVRSGLPIVKGTTIKSFTLYKLREEGSSFNRIRDYYPHLAPDQIKGAIRFERFLDAEAA